jgi:hypothetical protein
MVNKVGAKPFILKARLPQQLNRSSEQQNLRLISARFNAGQDLTYEN